MLGENWLIFALDPNLELDAETLVFHSGPKFLCFLVDFYKYFWFWCQTEIVSEKVYAVIWPVLEITSLKVFKQQVEWNTSVWYIFNIPFGFQRLREFWQVTNWFDFALFEFLIHMKIENNGLFWFWSNPSEHLRKSRNPWNPRNSIWNRICTLK